MSGNTVATTTTTAAYNAYTTAVEMTTTPTTTANPPSLSGHNKLRDSRGRFVASTAAAPSAT
jgi:hypothetical protein